MTIEEIKSNGGINFKNWNKQRVHIVVTYDCNMKCSFCINYRLGKKKKEYIKVSDVKYFLYYLKYVEKIESAIIVLLGGEPTLLPLESLKEIADLIHKLGYKAEFYTNGTLKEKLLELDGYIDYMTISNYSDSLLPFDNMDYLTKFKYSTITLTKLISRQNFSTFEEFDDFVDKVNKLPFNYDFAVMQKTTPNYELYHPKWVDEKLVPICEMQDSNGYEGAALYKGRLIKIPPVPQKDKKRTRVFKLYPNGNLTTTWRHDNPEINYKEQVLKKYRRSDNMLKNIYFAGHMEIDFENKEMSNLTKDYRCCIVDSEKILMPFEPIALNDEYAYGWPSFYYADELGNPSLSSKLILEREFNIIPNIDILVAFLQKEITAGTLGEIMYAAYNKKPMYIYYISSPTESDLYHTNQWYVIGMAEKINPGNVHVKEVEDITDLLNQLENDFNIKALRYPKVKEKRL